MSILAWVPPEDNTLCPTFMGTAVPGRLEAGRMGNETEKEDQSDMKLHH